jgi:hypothetical protein
LYPILFVLFHAGSQVDDPEKKMNYTEKGVVGTWTKPDEGWLKLNTDARFSPEENNGTWGAILRDQEGKVLLSPWGIINRCHSAEIAEALAAMEGTKAILPSADKSVILESDNAAVVDDQKPEGGEQKQVPDVFYLGRC